MNPLCLTMQFLPPFWGPNLWQSSCARSYTPYLEALKLWSVLSFWTVRTYLRAASLDSSTDVAPITTQFPLEKIEANGFGSRMRTIAAAKRFGLYSQLRIRQAMNLRSNIQLIVKVETTFCTRGHRFRSAMSKFPRSAEAFLDTTGLK
jgi:hypothetical protein